MRPDPSRSLSCHSHERIFDAFLEQARSRPDATALSSVSGHCSYKQLEHISRCIAQWVLQHAAGEASPRVAVIANRSPALVYGMLGVARAGGAFLIVDNSYPQARIETVLEEWQPALVLDCCGGDWPTELLEGTASLSVPAEAHVALSQWDLMPGDLALTAVGADDIAYGFFTSGTTGKPKGILTHHAPLVHFVDWHITRHGFTPDERFSLLSGLGHDPVLRDVMTPLSAGATLCIPEQSLILDPARLVDWMNGERVSVCHLTPALGELIAIGCEIRDDHLDHLKWLYFGGDVLSKKVSQRLRNVASRASQVNFYGATETPQAMSCFDVPMLWQEGPLPIGKGIADVQLLVITPDGALAEEGERGEIVIRTPYLSRGYLNNADETTSRFVQNPLVSSGDSGDLCYRTGDEGMYRSDGQVLLVGRLDDQVKIRGFRVEPAEVSAKIELFDGISRAFVMAHEKTDGHKFLVGYYTCVAGQSVDDTALNAYLTQQLPGYEVPQRLVALERFPLLANGKIDRQALRVLSAEQDDQADSVCLDHLDEKTVQIIHGLEEILSCRIQNPDITFIELGGDSLSFINATLMIEKTIGSAPDGWESLPISELVNQVSAKTQEQVQKRSHPQLITMETSVLLRALSICLVVLWHMEVLFIPATSMLFVLSGASFARFLAPSIRTAGNIKPVLIFILGFGVPTLLWQLARFVMVGDAWWPQLFMLGTLIPDPEFPLWPFWYLDVLTSNLLLMAVAWWLVCTWQRGSANSMAHRLDSFQWSIAISLFCFVLAVLQVTLDVFNGEIAKESVAPFRWTWLLPLGMAMYYANTNARKSLVSGIAVILCATIYLSEALHDLAPLIDLSFIASVLLVIWVPKVKILALLKQPILLLASSTLFIYILHWTVLYHMPKTGLPDWPVLQFCLAMMVGIIAQQIWNRVMPVGVRVLQQAHARVRS